MKQVRLREGFSIMEALVSVALIGVALIPIYAFQRTLADASFASERQLEVMEVQKSALAHLKSIDLIAQPEGEIEIEQWTLTWRASRIAGESPTDGFMGPGIYALYLYQVEATLTYRSQERVFTLRRVAWEQVRNPFSSAP